jgi:hypothetical protein
MNLMQNRRSSYRIPVNIPGFIVDPVKPENKVLIETKITNLSRGGAYVVNSDFQSSQIIDLLLSIPGVSVPVDCRGVVQYNDGVGVGVEFVSSEDIFEHFINRKTDKQESIVW